MANYVYSVKTVKYGTPTGTKSMPVTLVTLPKTVKGSVNLDETEGTFTKFYTDQDRDPIMVTKTEEGEFSAVMQFYDMSYDQVAALKGGSRVTGATTDSFEPATGYTNVLKALEIEFDSGHKLQMYNASCFARITGGGGRDKMLALELKVNPLMTTDGTGSWRLYKEN
jgi:hypothetical protein